MSSVDVSIGNGPGVNEREFVVALHGYVGARAHFIIPQPEKPFDELPSEVCTFTRPHRHHDPFRYLIHTLSSIRQAERILRRSSFDLMVFRLDLLPFAPLYLTSRFTTPYALKTVGQGLVNTLYERLPGIGRPVGYLNRQVVARLLDGAIAADSVSPIQIKYLENLLRGDVGRITWIDNAVNTARFCPEEKSRRRKDLQLDGRDPIVGYVGGLPWERGGQALIDALAALRERFPNIGAVIVGGNGKLLENLKARSRSLGVEDRCEIIGAVPFTDVPAYLNAFDVCVSINTRADRRAASELKIRQYIACGKPVVASPGGNDFLVSEGLGTIVDPHDSRAIAASLDRWLSLSEAEQHRHAARAYAYARDHLSVEASVRRRLDLWSRRVGEMED